MGWMTWVVIAVAVYSIWMYVYAMGGSKGSAMAPVPANTATVKESFVGLGVNQAADEERFAESAPKETKSKESKDEDVQKIFEDLSQTTDSINAIMKRFKEKLYPSTKETFKAARRQNDDDGHETTAGGSDDEDFEEQPKAAKKTIKKKKPEPVVHEEEDEDIEPETFETLAPPPPAMEDHASESFAVKRRVTAPVTRHKRVERFVNAPPTARYIRPPYTGVQSSAFYDSMVWE